MNKALLYLGVFILVIGLLLILSMLQPLEVSIRLRGATVYYREPPLRELGLSVESINVAEGVLYINNSEPVEVIVNGEELVLEPGSHNITPPENGSIAIRDSDGNTVYLVYRDGVLVNIATAGESTVEQNYEELSSYRRTVMTYTLAVIVSSFLVISIGLIAGKQSRRGV